MIVQLIFKLTVYRIVKFYIAGLVKTKDNKNASKNPNSAISKINVPMKTKKRLKLHNLYPIKSIHSHESLNSLLSDYIEDVEEMNDQKDEIDERAALWHSKNSNSDM